MRIQKFIAQCGVASRRKAEELVEKGLITINGEVAKIGQSVDPDSDEVMVDGKRVVREHFEYYLLNKPKGVLSAVDDEHGRKTVVDLIETSAKIFPVGRLDKDTVGVLLLTNDGDFAQKVIHPSSGLEKEYGVVLDKPLDDARREKIASGLSIDGRKVSVRFVGSDPKKFSIVIKEGRKHIVKRLFERVGFRVLRLIRLRVGPITLGNLKTGEYRRLTKSEIESLVQIC